MWEDIYEEIYPQLLKYAVSACQDRALAEDIAQEAFVRALQCPETLEDLGPGQRRAWLFRTMKNLLCDKYRRVAVESRFAQQITEDAVSSEPGFEAIENALVLARLSDEERMLFQLRYMEDYNAAEISEMLGMPSGTIRAKLSRCRKRLKEMLDTEMEE